MNKDRINYNYIFHATESSKDYLSQIIKKNNLENVELISNEKIKNSVIKNPLLQLLSLVRFH